MTEQSWKMRRVVEDHVVRPVRIFGGMVWEFEVDLLECGHVLSAANDLYGPRFPSRRRCTECAGSSPPLGVLVEEVQSQ